MHFRLLVNRTGCGIRTCRNFGNFIRSPSVRHASCRSSCSPDATEHSHRNVLRPEGFVTRAKRRGPSQGFSTGVTRNLRREKRGKTLLYASMDLWSAHNYYLNEKRQSLTNKFRRPELNNNRLHVTQLHDRVTFATQLRDRVTFATQLRYRVTLVTCND